ncbi:MAG: DUF2924 domain-containing protein [Alphaproteobacteria bacterium]
MARNSRAARQDPEQAVARLSDLPHPELAARWRALSGAAPPKGLSRRLLLLALAYRVQADVLGDLDPATDRRLRRIAAGVPNSGPAPNPGVALKPGMRLMREWNGRTHIVDVTADGLLWNGTPCSSLSAIARAITGARWSGPRFFGLRNTGA